MYMNFTQPPVPKMPENGFWKIGQKTRGHA